jgi:hypothetical protein
MAQQLFLPCPMGKAQIAAMSRSALARSLGPFAAILWGIFLGWSAWLAAVWGLHIGPVWLGFSAMPEALPPRNADLRKAILLLAENADLIWLVLATANLHLHLSLTHGLSTARRWLLTTSITALLLGVVEARFGVPFGGIIFYQPLGARLLGVPAGWLLLWAVLTLAAREAALKIRPRASHAAASALAGALAFLTTAALLAPALALRAWWSYRAGAMPLWAWAAWFAVPCALAFSLREKNILTASAPRSWKPLIVLLVLNAIALLARLSQ